MKLLSGWVVYFILYVLTENLIPAEKCHIVHCGLDDIIPFNELFFIPYFLWYFLVAGMLLYYLLYDVDSFKILSKYIIVTQAVAMLVYIIYPTQQLLRPEVFPRDNFLTQCIAVLYAVDTNTGVCPSLHVAYSIGIASVWRRRKGSWRGKILVIALAALICASTCFIKQHSAVDFFAALPVCLLAEVAVYGKFSRKKASSQNCV